jgi:hypothetical protein
MKISVFTREQHAETYESNDLRDFESVPRTDEFISIGEGALKRYFQVVAVHYPENANIEVYAIHTEPSWLYKKSGNIGFSFK